MKSLRDRCARLLDSLHPAPSTSNIDSLVAFVVAETGRKADRRLEQSLPLVLYFTDDAARDEFIAAFHEAKPNVLVKKLP